MPNRCRSSWRDMAESRRNKASSSDPSSAGNSCCLGGRRAAMQPIRHETATERANNWTKFIFAMLSVLFYMDCSPKYIYLERPNDFLEAD